MNQTITLPRSAVEQALKALEADNSKLWPSEKRAAAITFLRERLEQPQVEQEPVAWIENIGGGVSYNPYHEAARKLPDGVRFDLYTRPQPCQPLTDAQINDHRLALPYDGEDLPDPWDFKQGVRAAERAHRIGGEA